MAVPINEGSDLGVTCALIVRDRYPLDYMSPGSLDLLDEEVAIHTGYFLNDLAWWLHLFADLAAHDIDYASVACGVCQ